MRRSRLYVRPLFAADGASDELFREAIVVNEDWPYYRARTQLAFGAWLRSCFPS